MSTIESTLNGARQQLQASDSAQRDAEILLCFVVQKSLSFLRTYPEFVLDENTLEKFYALIARRAEGVPVAYLLGEREFWSMSFSVNDATLIPRPETEILVQTVLDLLDVKKEAKILDLGTGSGAIAVALASERPAWRMCASDASIAALRMAEKNAKRHRCSIEFVMGSWLSSFTGRTFDVIVSNPPYIAADDPHLQQGDLRFEPTSALASGDDGLQDIRQIIAQAPDHLSANGYLVLEHGFDQAETVRELMMLNFDAVRSVSDLSGWQRVTLGKKR